MSGSLNEVSLIGHLGRDPEIRATQDGREVATLSVATTESWKDKQTGERKDRTEWHRVAIFGDGLVGVARSYLRKGSKVFLRGVLRTRKWTDQSGEEKYSTEVVLQGYACSLVLLGGPPNRGDEVALPTRGDVLQDDEIPF